MWTELQNYPAHLVKDNKIAVWLPFLTIPLKEFWDVERHAVLKWSVPKEDPSLSKTLSR